MRIQDAAPRARGEMLVQLKPGVALEEMPFEVLDRLEVAGKQVLHVKTLQDEVALSQDPRVARAAPNHLYERASLRPDDLDERLWGLSNSGNPGADISAPEAWRITTGKRENGPIVAVLDTGIDFAHNDLQANLWTNTGEIPGNGIDDDGNGVIDDVHGFDATQNRGGGEAGGAHGTHCAGTIAAVGNNSLGVTGVNWEGRLMAVKIFPDDGDTCSAATILRAIDYADKNGARVTSNSWTGGGYNPFIKEAFENASALHVFAAGNDRSNNDQVPSYPSNLDIPNSVVVAASDRNDQIAFFSNYGPKTVDLAAPGHEILSTVPDQGYATFSGTSMACPHVAGVAALVASAYPEATNQQIKNRLLFGVDPVPAFAHNTASGGRLNAANAVKNDALPPAPPTDFLVRPRPAEVLVAWTPTGDDGWCGQPAAYELRVSPRPLGEEGALDEANLVEAGRSAEAGKQQRSLAHLMPSSQPRQVHVGLQLIDKVGNRSRLAESSVTLPACRMFFENDGWEATGSWTTQDLPGRPGVQSATGEATLTSRPIDLAASGDTTLYFETRHQLEPHYEGVTVEIALAGTDRWREVGRLEGDSHGWQIHRFPVHDFDGQTVQLRFRSSGAFELAGAAVTGLDPGSQLP
ncbi:hypothetical protein DYH09_24585 [bacterium CPR1]|nr:hypothetical protein [bacterium CPR1]